MTAERLMGGKAVRDDPDQAAASMQGRVERWQTAPDLPATHYIDNRIHTDPVIFAEERKRIFAAGWKLACHESELPEPGSFRTLEVAGVGLIVLRGRDGGIRTFFNACPHRGARLLREERGTLRNRIQCFYHLWSFDLEGNCTGITRPDGYGKVGLGKDDVCLRPVRTEVLFGLVFVSLNDRIEPLGDFLGPMVESMRPHLDGDELEVFHYHRAEIRTNWKLWVDNNSEQYHEYLHVLNRKTGMAHPSYHERRWRLNPNSHNVISQGTIAYGGMGLDARTDNLMPGMNPDGMVVMLLFPDVMINVRATVMRLDTITPLEPGRTVVEWRGLGLRSDSPEVRDERIRHHNQVWGPAGRNLPEDIEAVESQWRNMASGAHRWSIFAREEELRPQDDANLRAFYREWGRRVGRAAHDPSTAFGEEAALAAEAAE